MTALDNYHFTQTEIKRYIGDRHLRKIEINKLFYQAFEFIFHCGIILKVSKETLVLNRSIKV